MIQTFHSAVVARKNAGGGGSPAWYESIAPGSTTNYQTASFNGQIFGGKVTPSTSGTCTKISVFFGFVNNTNNIKMALLTTGGVVLASGTTAAPNTSSDQWVDLAIGSPPVVSSGTPYVVMYVCSSNTVGQGRYLPGQPADSAYENYDQVYATFPSGVVALSGSTNNECVRMEVTP